MSEFDQFGDDGPTHTFTLVLWVNRHIFDVANDAAAVNELVFQDQTSRAYHATFFNRDDCPHPSGIATAPNADRFFRGEID
jgi:hypothetical protein